MGHLLSLFEGGGKLVQLLFQVFICRVADHPEVVGEVQRGGKTLDLGVVEQRQAQVGHGAAARGDVHHVFNCELSVQGLQRLRHVADDAGAEYRVAAASIVDSGVTGMATAVFHQFGDERRQDASVFHQPLTEETEGVVGGRIVADQGALLVEHRAATGGLFLVQRCFEGAKVRLHGKQRLFGAGSQFGHFSPLAVNGFDDVFDALDFGAVAEGCGDERSEDAGVDGVHLMLSFVA
ncbi:hypothetical protein BH11CYA1_BH11CYA1_06830 [soil metagenome]